MRCDVMWCGVVSRSQLVDARWAGVLTSAPFFFARCDFRGRYVLRSSSVRQQVCAAQDECNRTRHLQPHGVHLHASGIQTSDVGLRASLGTFTQTHRTEPNRIARAHDYDHTLAILDCAMAHFWFQLDFPFPFVGKPKATIDEYRAHIVGHCWRVCWGQHTHTYTYTHIHTHAHIHTRTHTYTHTHTHPHIHTTTLAIVSVLLCVCCNLLAFSPNVNMCSMRRRRAFQNLTAIFSDLDRERTLAREQDVRDTMAFLNLNVRRILTLVRSGRSLYDVQLLYVACIYYTMSVLCCVCVSPPFRIASLRARVLSCAYATAARTLSTG